MSKSLSKRENAIEALCTKVELLDRKLLTNPTKPVKVRRTKRKMRAGIGGTAVNSPYCASVHAEHRKIDFILKNRNELWVTFERLEPMISYILRKYRGEEKNNNNQRVPRNINVGSFLKRQREEPTQGTGGEFIRECCHRCSQVKVNNPMHDGDCHYRIDLEEETGPIHQLNHEGKSGQYDPSCKQKSQYIKSPTVPVHYVKSLQYAMPRLRQDFVRMKEQLLANRLEKCEDNTIYSKAAALLEVLEQKVNLMGALATVCDTEYYRQISQLRAKIQRKLGGNVLATKARAHSLAASSPAAGCPSPTDAKPHTSMAASTSQFLKSSPQNRTDGFEPAHSYSDGHPINLATYSTVQQPLLEISLNKLKVQQRKYASLQKPLQTNHNGEVLVWQTGNSVGQCHQAVEPISVIEAYSKEQSIRKTSLQNSKLGIGVGEAPESEYCHANQQHCSIVRSVSGAHSNSTLQGQLPISSSLKLQLKSDPTVAKTEHGEVGAHQPILYQTKRVADRQIQDNEPVEYQQPSPLGHVCSDLQLKSDQGAATGAYPGLSVRTFKQQPNNATSQSYGELLLLEESAKQLGTKSKLTQTQLQRSRNGIERESSKRESESNANSQLDTVRDLPVKVANASSITNTVSMSSVEPPKQYYIDLDQEVSINPRTNFIENRDRLVEECSRLQSFLKKVKPGEPCRPPANKVGTQQPGSSQPLPTGDAAQMKRMTYAQYKRLADCLSKEYLQKNSPPGGTFPVDLFRFCFVDTGHNFEETAIEIVRRGRGKTKPPTIKLPRMFRQSNVLLLDHGRDFENTLIEFAQLFSREADEQVLCQRQLDGRVKLLTLPHLY